MDIYNEFDYILLEDGKKIAVEWETLGNRVTGIISFGNLETKKISEDIDAMGEYYARKSIYIKLEGYAESVFATRKDLIP